MKLVITPGDPAGIGPEVTEKAILKVKASPLDFLIVGSKSLFPKKSRLFKMKNVSFVEPPKELNPDQQMGWSIDFAARNVLNSPKKSALVTGPINKEKLRRGGYPFNGHTDFLASLMNAPIVAMVLANSIFRVALVTQHCSLAKVSSLITQASIEKIFEQCYQFCVSDLGLKNPKIAILGLNPHSGENGLLGLEEKEVIIPTIEVLQKKFPLAKITGPHPADSFFANELAAKKNARHDMTIAMYHDQGLIPVKLSDFKNCMNLTLGLPIVRTSVDHGTAYDITGKNKADPSSMIYAIKGAEKILKQRSKT